MKEPFWIVLGVLLVAYIGVYFGLTSSNQTQTARFIKTIDTHVKAIELAQKEEIHGRPMIEAYVTYKNNLVQEYNNLVKFYMEKDKKFESWFTELAITNNDEEPQGARFSSIQKDQIERLRKELTRKSADEQKALLAGDGKAEDFDRTLQIVQKSSSGLKIVQKSWWMLEHFLNACRKNGVRNIHRCDWGKSALDETLVGKMPIATTDGTPPVSEKVFGYTTLPMEIRVELPYSQVSLFIEEIIASSADTKVLIGLKSMKVSKKDLRKEDYLKNVEIFWEKPELSTQDEQNFQKVLEQFQKAQQQTIQNVVLDLELFAYDFFERTDAIKESPK